MNALRNSFIILISLFLISCGGSSDNDSEPLTDVIGVWNIYYSDESDPSSFMLITSKGDVIINTFDEPVLGRASLNNGTLTIKGNFFSDNSRVTLTGPVDNSDIEFSANYHGNDENDTIIARRDSSMIDFHLQGADLSQLAGFYDKDTFFDNFLNLDVDGSVEIRENGDFIFNQYDSNCSINGKLKIINPLYNEYQVTFNPSAACGSTAQLTGYGYSYERDGDIGFSATVTNESDALWMFGLKIIFEQ